MNGSYEVGIIAAGRHIVAIVLLTAALTLLPEQQVDALDLAWVYLTVAFVVACISRAALSRSAARMAMAAEQSLPARKARVLILTDIRLKMMAVAMAVLTLAPPPRLWVKLLSTVSSDWLAGLSWPAVTSAVVAFAIANARAARAARADPTGRTRSLPPNSTCA